MNKFKPYTTEIVPSVSLQKQGNKYYNFASRESCFSREELFISWFVDKGCSEFISAPNQKIIDYFLDEKSFLETLKVLATNMLDDWEGHLRRYQIHKQEIIRCGEELAKAVKTTNHHLIIASYSKFNQVCYSLGEYIWSAWAVIHHMENEVTTHFSDKIELIMALEQPIEFMKMQKELHSLSPSELVKKYGWLKMYGSVDNPYTEQDFETLRKDVNPDEIQNQLQQMQKTKTQFSSFLQEIKDENLKKKVIAVHTYAFLKTDRIDTWKKGMFYKKELDCYLVQRMKRTDAEVANLSVQEIVGFLTDGAIPERRNTLLRSKNKALYYVRKGNIRITTNSQNIQLIRKAFEERFKGMSGLQGMVACKGKVKGTVKIIAHSEDLKKIKTGDIFVAKYTFPTFTPYMLKAAAIVTDDGGITSHAAIIGREHHKPCIVNTKKATSVLKDGDLIEVDATKGIIKILKRK